MASAPGSDHGTAAKRSTRDRLIDEAVSLFDERGYQLATTRELAERLGLKKASLYHHISSKEDVLYAICVEVVNRTIPAVRRALEESPGQDRLTNMIRAHLEAIARDREMHAVGQNEMRHLSPERRHDIEARRADYAKLFSTAIKQDQADGRIRRDVDPTILTLGLLGLINWPVFWYRAGRSESIENLAGTFTTMFLEGARPRSDSDS